MILGQKHNTAFGALLRWLLSHSCVLQYHDTDRWRSCKVRNEITKMLKSERAKCWEIEKIKPSL